MLVGSGARVSVGRKQVESGLAGVVRAMRVDARTGENARVDLSTNGGGRSFKKRVGVALADAMAYADARGAHDRGDAPAPHHPKACARSRNLFGSGCTRALLPCAVRRRR